METDGAMRKIPPQSIEAEQSVLGAMLLDRDVIPTVLEIVKEEDFYREDHKEIFRTIVDLFTHSVTVDIVTVSDALRKNGTLEKAGGLDYLTLLPTLVPVTSNAHFYAKIVQDKSLLRKLIRECSKIVDKGYEATGEASDVLEYAENAVYRLLTNRDVRDFSQIKEVIVSSVSRLEYLYNNQGKITGVPTGFSDLDKLTSGLQNSDLVLLAARPAMGKTAFALNIALHAATMGKVPTAIFSLEMSKEQLVGRLLASKSLIESTKIRDGSLSDDDWSKLASAIGPLSEAEIYIDDNAGASVTDIKSKCMKLKMENKLGLVIIDYLQLMESSRYRDNRQAQVADITRSLKIMAKDLNVPILCLSQLSRGPESRGDHRPMLADLRESGSIEQDADIVMFIYRDEYYNPESEKQGIAEIIVAKHRNGETRTVELGWKGAFTRFFDLEKHRTQP